MIRLLIFLSRYMWQVDSGAVFSPFPPLPRSEAVYDCAWNPVEHTVAIAAVGAASPGLIFCPDPSLVQQFDPQVSFRVRTLDQNSALRFQLRP